MSWRVIFAILLITIGASAWGGLRLGDWLVAHGPAAAQIPDRPVLTTVPVLDANGLPYVAQPPQPLVDGRLAVPEGPATVAWQIPEHLYSETANNPIIDVATTTITMAEAEEIASSGSRELVGIADVGDLALNTASNVTRTPLQPIEAPIAAPPPPAPPIENKAWQASLRQDLQACSAQGFFDRPSCAWSARKKYCAPNNAWGRTPDCPPKDF